MKRTAHVLSIWLVLLFLSAHTGSFPSYGFAAAPVSEEQTKKSIQDGFALYLSGDFQGAVSQMRKTGLADSHIAVHDMVAKLEKIVGFIPTAIGQDEFEASVRKGVAAYVDGREISRAIAPLQRALEIEPKHRGVQGLLAYIESEINAPERNAETYTCKSQVETEISCNANRCVGRTVDSSKRSVKIANPVSLKPLLIRDQGTTELTPWDTTKGGESLQFLEGTPSGDFIFWWWYPKSKRLVEAKSLSLGEVERSGTTAFECKSAASK